VSVYRVGLLGCGVVGQSVRRLLEDAGSTIEARLGARPAVTRVFLREGSPSRAHVPDELLTSNPADVCQADDVDIVVELMGGLERASELIELSLRAGKPVVTANKHLLAERGAELAAVAREFGVDLCYEAAVAGGVPVIRSLRESLASDRVQRVRAILNGTSNYILTRMGQEKLEFATCLEAAQQAGYAEADPTLDISGGDAAHKLTILATLAFGAHVGPEAVLTEGITDVAAKDIQYAKSFGYRFKPLAIGERNPDGSLLLRVHPALVPEKALLAHVDGALNTVHIESSALGTCSLTGPGAGGPPTAVSVVSDIVDVARNLRTDSQGRVPQRAFREITIEPAAIQPIGERRGAFYMRFCAFDRPGVLAELARVLGEHNVSIAHLVQDADEADEGGLVDIVVLTHACREADAMAALDLINSLDSVDGPARRFRIEEV